MKKFIIAVGLVVTTSISFAGRTDCPKATVEYIQIEGTKVMYLQKGSPWRTLGYLDKNDGTKERYSALLTAQATGSMVLVGYPIANYNCSAQNFETAAYIVRTHSN